MTEEQQLMRDSVARLFSEAGLRERGAMSGSAMLDLGLWRSAAEVGVLSLLVPESAGGVGLGVLEASLVAEVAGECLVALPVIEGMVAAALLARFDSDPVVADWLARLCAGDVVVTLVPAALDERPESPLIPGGGLADAVLYWDGDALSLGVPSRRCEMPANLGELPLARFDPFVAERHVVSEGGSARAAFEGAIDQWRLLVAAMLLGMAKESLRQAAMYARERNAFGRPIGGFQGVAHPLADVVTDVEGGRQLVRYALWSIATRAPDAAAMAPAACWWAAESAQAASLRALRTFGGYGLGLESQAQLFWRRCRALALLAGGSEALLDLSADRLWSAAVPDAELPQVGEVGIDFGLGEAAERMAERARRFFLERMTDKHREFVYTSGDGHDAEMERALAAAGLLHPDWPAEYGGQDCSALEMSALYRVYGDFAWWVAPANTTDMVGKIVMRFGSAKLKEDVLPLLASGHANCALGYSEPSCGSDVFAARTRATRDGDTWVIDGQKMFTSQGHFAKYCLMLTRTDTEAAKHAGLTLFLLPLDQPGYDLNRVDTLGNERTNVTFYSGMRVSDAYRLGDVNGGAAVMAAALALEQSTGDFFLIGLRRLLKHAVAWTKAPVPSTESIGRPVVRRALTRLHVRIAVLEALTRRAQSAGMKKQRDRSLGPMTKLFGSEAMVRSAAELMDAVGSEVLVSERSDLGWIELEARRSIATTIYAGTSEVQRSIIAEIALGLPRSRS
ncbi:MAG: acyl-CoA dehydrogenase [Pseudomonadota bacterium]|nr:acyl-CoA dehydrogenase [Pseudomonadota bacterium]